jgi:hypothetical protein
MDQQEQKDGERCVQERLIDELTLRGLGRPTGLTMKAFDDMLRGLCQKLAHMTPENLDALAEVAAAKPSGKDRDRFPIANDILEWARDSSATHSAASNGSAWATIDATISASRAGALRPGNVSTRHPNTPAAAILASIPTPRRAPPDVAPISSRSILAHSDANAQCNSRSMSISRRIVIDPICQILALLLGAAAGL